MYNKLIAKASAWALNREGATAIEYGLIAAGIAVAIVAIVFALGGHLSDAFTTIDTKIQGK